MPTLSSLTIPVSAEVLAAMLSPYLQEVQYLQSAVVEVRAPGERADGQTGNLVVGRGEFLSPSKPWYIRDTGHFNAMEFNLCYNQLAYTTVAQCVSERLLPVLHHMDFGMFRERQLSHMLIASLESRFRKPMRSGRFSGKFILDAAGRRGGMVLLKTRCSFGIADTAYSDGRVSLVILDSDSLRPSL